MVVAAVRLCHGRASEFAAPDHKSLVEQASLLQILYERGRGLVHFLRLHHDVPFDSAMVVPVAVIELNETHSAFSQPASEQAIGAEGTVEPFDAIRIKN